MHRTFPNSPSIAVLSPRRYIEDGFTRAWMMLQLCTAINPWDDYHTSVTAESAESEGRAIGGAQ